MQLKLFIENSTLEAKYLRTFFFTSDALKATCLSLRPDQTTYDEANAIIKKLEIYPVSSQTSLSQAIIIMTLVSLGREKNNLFKNQRKNQPTQRFIPLNGLVIILSHTDFEKSDTPQSPINSSFFKIALFNVIAEVLFAGGRF